MGENAFYSVAVPSAILIAVLGLSVFVLRYILRAVKGDADQATGDKSKSVDK